ncbi:MAG: 23S rRNA (uridine2552-2'-O)-methyltransferase [Candidatus Tokpelaia sp. JSC085]|nr:MAG: 23S rRNA (uridine2552-2'-O)-methyltransferase [Candidatus Tokpelaia sp. JSC085]
MKKKSILCRNKKIGLRILHTRIKKRRTAIKASSRHWLERHLNDPYVRQSWANGYRSRAAYKLIEINNRYKLLQKGQRVFDLGAAPGSWSQVAAHLVNSNAAQPSVVGIDYLHVNALPGVRFLEMDFLDETAPKKLLDMLGKKPHVIMSDMSAPTTGHKYTDHLRTVHLCESAANFAVSALAPGGFFLAKTFQGGAEDRLLAMLNKQFKAVYHVKPPSSRIKSAELYLLACAFQR